MEDDTLSGVGKEYTELGNVIDQLARTRNVRGPYNISKYIRTQLGRGINGSAWSQIMHGQTKDARRENMRDFALAFELDAQERRLLANAFLFLGLASTPSQKVA
jgi:hypothetical protein